MGIAEHVAPDVDEGIKHLSDDETRVLFDELVRERLGISGAEFKRRLVAGEYDQIMDNAIDHPGLMMLVMLSHSVD